MQYTTLNLTGNILNRLDRAQKILDREVVRRMKPYTPNRNGLLEKSARVIVPGTIMQHTPYARYQHGGKVMTTKDGRTFAQKYEKKPIVHDDWQLVHSRAKNVNAGPKWFDRMKADSAKELLEVTSRVLKGGNT